MTARSSLTRDVRGVAVIQFAIVAPVMFILIMGLGELAYQLYIQSVLTGAVQKAARDAGIQGNAVQTDAIDLKVQQQVRAILANATFQSTRTNYDSYSSIAPEPFTDSKYPATSSGTYDGVCNHGETYTDVNGNGQWDTDAGSDGQGLASDVTRYTMQVTYHRLFPIGLFGWGPFVTLSSTTLLKSQPYALQTVNTATGTCP